MSSLLSTLGAIFFAALAQGFIFALLGVGITMVFGLGQILNLSHGIFAISTVLVAYGLVGIVDSLFLAIPLSLVFIAVLSLVVDRILLRPVYKREGESRLLMGVFVTLGLMLLIEGFLIIYFPFRYSIPFAFGRFSIFGETIRTATVLIIVTSTVLLAGLAVFLNRTFLGKAMRTLFQSETGALLSGINPRRLQTLVFVFSGVLAGIAGLMHNMLYTVSVSTGFELTVMGFIVSIVGGLQNIKWVTVAGILLGILTIYANFFIGSFVSTLIPYLVVIGFLIAKPDLIS